LTYEGSGSWQTRYNGLVEAAGRRRRSILIVEDDDDVRELLEEYMADCGCIVASASDGRKALEQLGQLASREKPCLILLDLMMPVMTGPDFLAALRANERLADIPVVILSAYHGAPAGLDVQGVLRKPFDIQQLEALVQRFCPAKTQPLGQR
jgi:CheY-like chemotaxis protein